MFKVSIKNLNNELTHQSVFNTEEEANIWITSQSSIGTWGKSERELEENEALLQGEDLNEATSFEDRQIDGQTKTFFTFAAEYFIEVEDIGNVPLVDALRIKRNSFLSDSDWTQLVDSPLSAEAKAEWATYRQALRDLPDNTLDPANPEWPVKPS